MYLIFPTFFNCKINQIFSYTHNLLWKIFYNSKELVFFFNFRNENPKFRNENPGNSVEI